MVLTEPLINQSTAIRTKVLPEVYNIIKDIKCDFNDVKPYNTKIINWLKPVIDLTNFYVYPTNGITEGLNWWALQEKRGIYLEEGDYQWIKPTGLDIKYQTIPSSIDGNIVELDRNTRALDLAYVGSTKPFKVENLQNLEYVFFSLSKTFGVRNIRTGWLFTKHIDQRLEDLTHSAKYYNYFAHQIAEAIIENFDCNYVYNQLHQKQQKVCEIYNLQASDVVWLATSTDEQYKHLRRKNKLARISLCEYIV